MDAPLTQELRKFVAPEFVVGPGARSLVGRYARNFAATKVLVVTDPGVIAAGWAGEVIRSLEKEGLAYAVYHEVSPNPRDHEVMAGSNVYHTEGCDVLLAVGGGSPMDCAKGIGIVSLNGGHILDYEGVDKVEVAIPPMICVPTTGGTSADVSQFAIISDTRRRTKIAILSKMLVPDVSLIDPETLVTMSPELTAATAFDALTHGIEAYVSNASSALTDLLSLEAIRLITHHMLPAWEHPDDLALRLQVMRGSLFAGLAFSNASLGIIHAMAHSLGGLLDSPHGLCNATLLEAGIAFNYEAVPGRFKEIARAMVGGQADVPDALGAILGVIEALRIGTGVKRTLGEMGVSRADIPSLTRLTLADACLFTNPRWPTFAEVEELYERLL
ncbi:MAG TPA: alcohol dehydrogenase-like regulatory protein ErcA [Pantanalinema sp.]